MKLAVNRDPESTEAGPEGGDPRRGKDGLVGTETIKGNLWARLARRRGRVKARPPYPMKMQLKNLKLSIILWSRLSFFSTPSAETRQSASGPYILL